jgi:RNA polymerase sigma factor (sigma-70 family)
MSDYMQMERWPDEKLLQEANRGNTNAFLVFCVKKLPSLLRYVRYQCRSNALPTCLAEDFCHDAILKALDSIKSWQEEHDSSFPGISVAWVKKIACHLVLDWGRKNRRIQVSGSVDPEAPTTLSPDDAEEHEEIRKFLEWLGDNEREMLELVYIQGMAIQEAGEYLNLDKWAAYKTHERALEHLHDLLIEHSKCIPSWMET